MRCLQGLSSWWLLLLLLRVVQLGLQCGRMVMPYQHFGIEVDAGQAAARHGASCTPRRGESAAHA